MNLYPSSIFGPTNLLTGTNAFADLFKLLEIHGLQ